MASRRVQSLFSAAVRAHYLMPRMYSLVRQESSASSQYHLGWWCLEKGNRRQSLDDLVKMSVTFGK